MCILFVCVRVVLRSDPRPVPGLNTFGEDHLVDIGQTLGVSSQKVRPTDLHRMQLDIFPLP